MATPIWDPFTYRPLVAILAEKLAITNRPDASTTEESSQLLKLLTSPHPTELARADVRHSDLLAREITSPLRHEEAALLLGAFALRESSGKFFQIRGELCRMTAHLALARQLDPSRATSTCGRLALATLTVLCNNQAEGLKLIDASLLPPT